jgi:hypothetical protein
MMNRDIPDDEPAVADERRCGEARLNAQRLAYACHLPRGHEGDHHPNPCGHDGCTGLECIKSVPAMTPDQARATLCRSVAAQLEESVKRAEADLDARQAAPGFEPSPETNNIALVTLATLELRDSLLLSAKQFDKSSRPRILRPERSIRVVR